MGVLAEAISIVVPVSILDAKYPGGRAQYAMDSPNDTYCCDNHLTRIGFMVPEDVKEFVVRLAAYGIHHLADGKSIDLAVVDQTRGPTAPCDWLEFGVHHAGFGVAWMKGTSSQPMFAPDHWSIEQSRQMGFVAATAVSDRLIPVARNLGTETHLDLATGGEVHIGRTSPLTKRKRWKWW